MTWGYPQFVFSVISLYGLESLPQMVKLYAGQPLVIMASRNIPVTCYTYLQCAGLEWYQDILLRMPGTRSVLGVEEKKPWEKPIEVSSSPLRGKIVIEDSIFTDNWIYRSFLRPGIY